MQVIVLERCVMDGTAADKDRVAAGFFLVCIYGRLRYSDALHINSVKLDVQRVQGKVIGFLEATCKRTKTMMSLETKTRLLPVAVPIQSVGDTAWVETWLELRERIVVDYDAQRSLAAANVAAEVQTVRSLVNKLGKAQRAAEETLEMCDD
eukprot:s4799_g9.t1